MAAAMTLPTRLIEACERKLPVADGTDTSDDWSLTVGESVHARPVTVKARSSNARLEAANLA